MHAACMPRYLVLCGVPAAPLTQPLTLTHTPQYLGLCCVPAAARGGTRSTAPPRRHESHERRVRACTCARAALRARLLSLLSASPLCVLSSLLSSLLFSLLSCAILTAIYPPLRHRAPGS